MVFQGLAVLFKPILALHIKFSSCRNYWGGGGKNDMFAPPSQYFHWVGDCPPGSTPLDRRLCPHNVPIVSLYNASYKKKKKKRETEIQY